MNIFRVPKVLQIFIVAIMVIVVTAFGVWQYYMYKTEQDRVAMKQQEAARQDTAKRYVKMTYEELFDAISEQAKNGGSADITEIFQTSVGRYIEESLKKPDVIRAKGIDAVGCRARISDKLIEQGFNYDEVRKKSNTIYDVVAEWPSPSDDSDDFPSRSVVTVDIEKKKITAFTCELSDKQAEEDAKRNAELER